MVSRHRKVLMFGWELPPHNSGGLGVACYGMAKGLSGHGVDISFAMPRKLPNNASFMDVVSPNIPGMKVTAVNSLLQAYSVSKHYKDHYASATDADFYGPTIYDEALRFGQISAKWAQTQEADIIHAHDWMTYPAAMGAHHSTGVPWVAHVHATEYDRTGGGGDARISKIEYEGLRNAGHIITVSDYTRNVVINQYGLPRKSISVVHNGIDMVEFHPLDIRRVFPHDQIVLFVGRLTYQKGVDYLLNAAQKVLTNNPRTIFVIAGSGDMEKQLILQAATLGIGQRIIFTGFITGDRLKILYSMADLFVMPSVSEPYGLVALEAIAAGTPAIISKQSGVAEALSAVHKVDFWDIDKMAASISFLLDHPQAAHDQVIVSQREANMLTWERAAQQIISVYDTVI